MRVHTFNALAIGLTLTGATTAWGANAVEVISYSPGSSSNAAFADYLNASSALGEANRVAGEFGGVPSLLSPYNAPFATEDLVFIGSGGQITLKLDHYVEPLTDAAELGIFTAQFINEYSDGSGSDLLFNGDQSGIIRVSEDGENWLSLNNGDPLDLNTPTTGFVFPDDIPEWSSGDPDTYDAADFETPFTGSLDMNSVSAFEASRANAYGDTAGGNWVDLSGLGLNRIGFIQIERPLDADEATPLRLDAIYANRDAIGSVIPEPTTAALLMLGVATTVLCRRR